MTLIILACGLFGVGLFGVLSRRDMIGILIAIEVMMGAALLLLIGLAPGAGPESRELERVGAAQSIGLLVLVVAAAEAAVGLGLIVAVARRSRLTHLDEADGGRG